MGGRVILDKNYSLRLINHFENIISYVRIISRIFLHFKYCYKIIIIIICNIFITDRETKIGKKD